MFYYFGHSRSLSRIDLISLVFFMNMFSMIIFLFYSKISATVNKRLAALSNHYSIDRLLSYNRRETIALLSSCISDIDLCGKNLLLKIFLKKNQRFIFCCFVFFSTFYDMMIKLSCSLNI